MKQWLFQTAWRMTPPAPYSLFHLCFTAAGILLAFWAARAISRRTENSLLNPVLFLCGVILAAGECYKQLFLYYVVNGERYDWWYFPFQLCSLPMYLCLIIPFVPSGRFRRVLCTFMQDFSILGGIMALLEPSGLMHPYWTLTIHSLSWHIILLFIGLLIAFCRGSDTAMSGYLPVLPLFGIGCLIASLINVATHPLGFANMFYISPYYPSEQVVFHQIALKTGILLGNVIYLLSVCAGGLAVHSLVCLLSRNKTRAFDNFPDR